MEAGDSRVALPSCCWNPASSLVGTGNALLANSSSSSPGSLPSRASFLCLGPGHVSGLWCTKDASFSPYITCVTETEATRNRHNQQCAVTCRTTFSPKQFQSESCDIVHNDSNKQDKSETAKMVEEFHLLFLCCNLRLC